MPFLVPLLALAAPAAAEAAVSWKPGFVRASLWNDGMAEVSDERLLSPPAAR